MLRRFTIASALLLLGGLLPPARAETNSAPPRIAPSDPAAHRVPFSLTDFIDRHHKRFCGQVMDFGEGMDAWLSDSFRKPEPQPANGRMDKFISDKRLEDDNQRSRLKVSPALKLRDAAGLDFSIRVNGKLRLPRFEDRVALVLSSIDDNESVLGDLDRQQTLQKGDEGEGVASVRYYLKETLNFKASTDAGLRFRPEPDPRVTLRLRLYHHFERVTTRFTQTFFWEAQDGVGEKSQFDLDQQKPNAYLRRLSTTVLWSEASDGVEAGQSYSHYRYLSKRRVLGARVGVAGVLEPSARVENYTARLIYRQRLHRDWIFMELEPGVEFPRDRDFQATGFINLKFDIIFGDWQNE